MPLQDLVGYVQNVGSMCKFSYNKQCIYCLFTSNMFNQ